MSRVAVVSSLFLLLASAGVMSSGCTSLYSEGAQTGAGIAGAAVAAQITHNATVATGIGLGFVAAAKAGVQYTERVMHGHEQDNIALAAGPLNEGAIASWSVEHTVPIEANEHGQVTVSRTISKGALSCKEIVFSIEQDATKKAPASRSFYTAAICRDSGTWKWASAEPATARWGSLQ
jgi:hypothetical protein